MAFSDVGSVTLSRWCLPEAVNRFVDLFEGWRLGRARSGCTFDTGCVLFSMRHVASKDSNAAVIAQQLDAAADGGGAGSFTADERV